MNTYKLIKVFNVKTQERTVLSAEYSLICDFKWFKVNAKTENMLIEYCKKNKLDFGRYTIVKYKNEKPVEIVGSLFYKVKESFLDCANWDERIEASVALNQDLV